MNNECTVHFLLAPGSFGPTGSLAGEEAAGVVSTERHLVTLPLPSRVQVAFTPPLISITLPLCPVSRFCRFIYNVGIFTYSWKFRVHGALKVCQSKNACQMSKMSKSSQHFFHCNDCNGTVFSCRSVCSIFSVLPISTPRPSHIPTSEVSFICTFLPCQG